MTMKLLYLSFVVIAATLFFSGIFISTESSADHGPEKMWKRQIKPYFTAHETGTIGPFKINIEREKHGALLDAEILAEVYLEMNGGRQQNIDLIENVNKTKKSTSKKIYDYSKKIYEVTDQEKKKHQELLDFINNF